MASVLFVGSTFLCIAFIVAGLSFVWNRRVIRIEARVREYLLPDRQGESPSTKVGNREKGRLSRRLLEYFRRLVGVRMSKQGTKELELMLRDAGYPYQLTPVDFRIVQLGLCLLFASVSFVLFYGTSSNLGQILLLVTACGGLGIVYPRYYLKTKKKQRIAAIERDMSDFFDMVTLLIEAGMGLDLALDTVSKKNEGPLPEEFGQTMKDMQLGKSRREAFSDLRDRIGSDLFQSVIRQLIQADRLGMGMVDVLRAQTHRIREHRMQATREKAMKVPVKMLLPMVAFIMPCLFIVILGPAALKLMAAWV